MSLNLAELQNFCRNKQIRWTDHALKRLMQRGISQQSVIESILDGEITEEYPEDYPYPSCLICGKTLNGTILHVVCGFGSGILWIVTAYKPSPIEWEPDMKTRKRSSK